MQDLIYVSKVIGIYLLGFFALAGVSGMIVNIIMHKYTFRNQ
ncbi:MAG TPA: hypothetical protein VFD03_04485 [Clostridia bacterium]|nr:hypothetical protein [Clostridia bacterium]